MDMWDGCRVFAARPKNVLKSGYLYTQPVHASQTYDNSIEDFFSKTVENDWPENVALLRKGEDISVEMWADLVKVIASLRARVPLTLDAVVELLREHAIRACDSAAANSPPIPSALVKAYRKATGKQTGPHGTRDLVEAEILDMNIDPHRAILSMANLTRRFPLFQPYYGFGKPCVLYNNTGTPFLSSDNPVCYFAGNRTSRNFLPYSLDPEQRLSFIFSVNSDIAIVNSEFFGNSRTKLKLSDRKKVAAINRIIARFSYRYIFSSDSKHLEKFSSYGLECPRPVYEDSLVGDGEVHHISHIFGKPKRLKNSWSFGFER